MLAILTTHPIQYQVPLWQALAKDGRVPFEVWYLTSHATRPSHDREFGKEFAWDLDMLAGYPHRFLEVARGATPNSFWKCRLKEKLSDRLRESGARALWINGWQVAAYWQAVREAKAAGVEVWLRGESNALRQQGARSMGPGALKETVKRIVLGQLFRRVDRFLYIGSANKRLYQKFGVPDEKLFPAPYAVDSVRFARQARELGARSREIRSEWRIPEDAFCILFCGKFIPKKRPADLIAAVQLLRSKQSGKGQEQSATLTPSPLPLSAAKPHLLFAGSGELGDAMRDACRVVFDAESGQQDHQTTGPQSSGQWSVVSGRSPSSSHAEAPVNREPITDNAKPAASFAGFLNQTQVSSAYVAADVLVLPSDYSETWGLVVNEAMASGLPCIISDRCGCAEDLGKLSSNAIYECGNIQQLTQELTKFEKRRDRELTGDQLKEYSFDETIRTIVRLAQN